MTAKFAMKSQVEYIFKKGTHTINTWH